MTITQIKARSEKMDGALEAMLPEMEAIYKDIHRHPELSIQEARTAQLAAGYPAKYNWEVTAGLNAR